jgi:hypothetical protein
MRPATWSTRSPKRRSKAAKWRRPYFRCKLCGGGHWKRFDSGPGCSRVASIAINRVPVDRAESNWSMCVVSPGAADPNTAARAAIYVQQAPPQRLRSDAGLTGRLRLAPLAAVPSGEQCIHEIIEGYRVQIHIANAKAKMLTHRGIGLLHSWSKSGPHSNPSSAFQTIRRPIRDNIPLSQLALAVLRGLCAPRHSREGIEAHP